MQEISVKKWGYFVNRTIFAKYRTICQRPARSVKRAAANGQRPTANTMKNTPVVCLAAGGGKPPKSEKRARRVDYVTTRSAL